MVILGMIKLPQCSNKITSQALYPVSCSINQGWQCQSWHQYQNSQPAGYQSAQLQLLWEEPLLTSALAPLPGRGVIPLSAEGKGAAGRAPHFMETRSRGDISLLQAR